MSIYHSNKFNKSIIDQNCRAYFGNSASAMLLDINLAISESNTGYANSGVPIRLSLKCVVDSQLQDNSSSAASLNQFYNLAGKFYQKIIWILRMNVEWLVWDCGTSMVEHFNLNLEVVGSSIIKVEFPSMVLHVSKDNF